MHIRSNEYYIGGSMVVRTLEPWLSKKELCAYLKINKNILEQLYPLFTEGVHYRRKNPLKENSAKVWKATKVDQLLCESSSILTRRIKKIKLKNQLECSNWPERFWKCKERKKYITLPKLPPPCFASQSYQRIYWYYSRLITRRSEVQISPPPPNIKKGH